MTEVTDVGQRPVGDRTRALHPEEFAAHAAAQRPRVLRFAAAFLGDRHLAEDVVQEALGRLFEHRDRYPLHELFGPYLVKTVARLAIDQRRARRARHAQLERVRSSPPLLPPSPEAMVERDEMADRVTLAVAALPERERACFLLTVCEGLSYRETADALALTYAEVNNAIHRARTALRSSLAAVVEEER
jgi:RNA polymerase sigma-70 factor (ECF subfamily)